MDFSPLAKGTKESIQSVPYPGWGQFLVTIFILISMVPIIVVLVLHAVRNPDKWIRGFKKTFSNPHNFLPDPCMLDPSRKRTSQEVEAAIMEEIRTDAE